MQNLKVGTLQPAVRNAIIFVLLSIFFLILQQSLQSSLPFVNRVFLTSTLKSHWFVLLFGGTTVWLLYHYHRFSVEIFSVFCGLIAFRSLEGIFLNFSKLQLFVLFIYSLVAYSIVQLLRWTLTQAAYRANYSAHALSSPMAHKIPLRVQGGARSFTGVLTNWDEVGAFVYLDEKWSEALGEVSMELELAGHCFKAQGQIVARAVDERGIGIEWEVEAPGTKLSWSSLVDHFEELGWKPELLR